MFLVPSYFVPRAHALRQVNNAHVLARTCVCVQKYIAVCLYVKRSISCRLGARSQVHFPHRAHYAANALEFYPYKETYTFIGECKLGKYSIYFERCLILFWFIP